MLGITEQNVSYVTVVAAVAANLDAKEGYIVEQVASAGTVQLFTSGIPYAVLLEQIAPGDGRWKAALINGGGLCPVVAGGVITTPAYVKAASGGKVTAAVSTNLALGVKRSPTDSAADGDFILVDLGLTTMP